MTTNVFVLPSARTNVIVASGNGILTNSGTLAFNDFQMSQDIIIPVTVGIGPNGNALPYVPSLARIALSNPRLDPLESSDLIPPTLGLTNTTLLNGLSPQFTTGGKGVVNFVQSVVQVNENVGSRQVSLSVSRNGGKMSDSVSVNYRIDYGPPADSYDTFPLQAGSDYATPNADYTSVTGTLNWGPERFQ